jgi:hypothetical protein
VKHEGWQTARCHRLQGMLSHLTQRRSSCNPGCREGVSHTSARVI